MKNLVESSTTSYNPQLQNIFGKLVITDSLIEQFVNWCISIGNSFETCRDRANYLKKPLNLNNDHSVKAYRLLLKMFGKPIPEILKIKRSGIDLRIPSDSEIIESLEKARQHESLFFVYRVLIESGARLKEVIYLLNNYESENDKQVNGFYKYVVSKTKSSKKVFYIYHITPIQKIKISEHYITKLSRELGIVRPKYIRKWVATKMLQLGIPSEIIDFIQGRTPSSILAKHYLKLTLLADQHYVKYIEHLKTTMNNS